MRLLDQNQVQKVKFSTTEEDAEKNKGQIIDAFHTPSLKSQKNHIQKSLKNHGKITKLQKE